MGRARPGRPSQRPAPPRRRTSPTPNAKQRQTKMAPPPPFHRSPSHTATCLLPHTPAWAFPKMCPEPVLNDYLPTPPHSVSAWEVSPEGWPGAGAQRALTLTSSGSAPWPRPSWLLTRTQCQGTAAGPRGPCPHLPPPPPGAWSEHLSTQAQGPQMPAGKGPQLSGSHQIGKAAVSPWWDCSSCPLPPVVGVKGPSVEVEKPLGLC